MNRKKLNKIRRQMDAYRKRGGIKSTELQSLAQALGRDLSKRGKEPTWVSQHFSDLRPLSIPHHGSHDLARFTAASIIDQLELDLERWETEIESDENQEGN